MLLRPKKTVRMSYSKLKVTEEKRSTIHKSQTGFWFKKKLWGNLNMDWMLHDTMELLIFLGKLMLLCLYRKYPYSLEIHVEGLRDKYICNTLSKSTANIETQRLVKQIWLMFKTLESTHRSSTFFNFLS